jgi:hypothetical protein
MFYKKLRFVFGRCFARLLCGFYVFYTFFLPGFEQVITRLPQGSYPAFTRRLQNCSSFFTRFPHICLQCFLQGFDNVLYKAFTMSWQGFYKVFSMILRGLYKAFQKACTRLLPNLMPCADRRAASSCKARQFGRAG